MSGFEILCFRAICEAHFLCSVSDGIIIMVDESVHFLLYGNGCCSFVCHIS